MTIQTILPPPFEWIQIPAGKVTIGYGDWEGESVNRQYVVKRTQDFQIESFSIAKYPVTNAQYDVFVNHPDGYNNPKWWDFSDDAQKWFYERKLHGGSWINPPELVNALVYDGAPPYVQDYCYGFRCVRLLD